MSSSYMLLNEISTSILKVNLRLETLTSKPIGTCSNQSLNIIGEHEHTQCVEPGIVRVKIRVTAVFFFLNYT